MAQVSVTINGRQFRMACEDGQENHLLHLAQDLDQRISDLRAKFGEIGDTRLTVMAALTVADELAEAGRRIARLEEEAGALQDARIVAAKRTSNTQTAVVVGAQQRGGAHRGAHQEAQPDRRRRGCGARVTVIPRRSPMAVAVAPLRAYIAEAGLRGATETQSPGPYRSLRELSLSGLVGPDIWRPPTFVGNPGSSAPTASAAPHSRPIGMIAVSGACSHRGLIEAHA